MKCADIMNTNLESLSEKDTIQRAAEIMADAGVGFLPICDQRGRVIGVVTDRDLTVRAIAREGPARLHDGGHGDDLARDHLPRDHQRPRG